MAADPSHNVHSDLLPHIHLISAYRYPLVPRFGIPDVTDWLLNAPRIARDGAPFFWTFLDTPQDGSVILTWQPLQRLGTEFASDGYIWPRGELYYQQEIRDGLILEIFHQPFGYRPGDEFATHARRRFRLMPPKVPNPNTPQVDPNLWLVHYGPIDEREPLPVKKIRVEPRIRALMEQRGALQRAGQITRKEFMLSDRVNWPQIPLPRDVRAAVYPGSGPGAAASGPASHHVPQQMAYPPQGPGNLPAPPPSKRARHGATAAAAAAGPGPGGQPGGVAGPGGHHMVGPMDVAVYDDDEDTSRGDMFDNITPRDVSIERYKQNHEWMEEVISSPYRIGQIGYADLGLGLKGELEPLTDGVFEGQGFEALQRAPGKTYVGRLDPDLAEEFRKRVNEKVAATHAEIAAMKVRHEKLVAGLRHHSVIKKAEHDLRFAPAVDDADHEVWRLDARLESINKDGLGDGSITTAMAGDGGGRDEGGWVQQKKSHKSVEEVVAGIETALQRKVVSSGQVVRVQDGGYREPTPEPTPEPVPEPEAVPEVPTITTDAAPATGTSEVGAGAAAGAAGAAASQHPSPAGSQLSGIIIDDTDMDMGGTAAGLLDQMESVFSPAATTPGNTTPGNFPTPNASSSLAPQQPTGLSQVANAADLSGEVRDGQQDGAAAAPAPAVGGATRGDVAMADAAAAGAQAQQPTAATGTEAPSADSAASAGQDDWVVVPPGGTSPTGSASGAGGAPGTQAPPAAQGTATAGALLVPVAAPTAAPTTAAAGSGSVPVSSVLTPGGDQDFGSLADLDTAGEALAGLEDDGLDLGMDMEDSAFGDAFHGSENN